MSLKSLKMPLLAEEKQTAARTRAEEKQAVVDDVLARFDRLPDAAHVRLPVVIALFGCSAASVWRHVKSHRIPAPRKFGSRVTAWNVGELKACLSGDTGGRHA